MERPLPTNLLAAKELAMRWLIDDKGSERAHVALAKVLLALGDIPAANAEYARVPMRGTRDNALIVKAGFEVSVMLGHGAEARTLFDSVRKAGPDFPGNPVYWGILDLMFGRFARYDAIVAERAAALAPEALPYFRQMGRAISGMPSPDLDRLTWAFQATLRDSACSRRCRLDFLTGLGMLGVTSPTWSPAFAPQDGPDFRLTSWYTVATGDSTAIRKTALELDRKARENVRMGWSEDTRAILAANAFLAIRDTAAALNSVRFYLDSAMARSATGRWIFCIGRNMCTSPVPLWPRTMLLRADLAAAKGSSSEAKIWYDKVLDLWSAADAEFQPVVERVRKARAALAR